MPNFTDNPKINAYLEKYNSRYSPNNVVTLQNTRPMGLGILAGSLLSAGGTFLQNWFNQKNATTAYNRQKQLNLDQFNYNKQLQEIAHHQQMEANEKAFNLERDWALNERDYNSPQNQLARLRAAGMNPALAYDGMQNTVSQPLDMSAQSPSGASVGGSSAPLAQTAVLPEITNILQGLKGLELANQQIKESQARQDLTAAQAENIRTNTARINASSAFWTDLAKYDVEWKKNNARSVYRDILEKTWKYHNFLPKSLELMSQQVDALDLSNRFNRESFKDRLDEIVKRNLLMDKQTSYYGDLKRNIDSQISYRDFAVNQMELNGVAQRRLFNSQSDINESRKQIMELQKQATQDLANGNYLEAIKKMTLLNFLQQAVSGSLYQNLPSLPTPSNLLPGDFGNYLPMMF